MTQLLDSPESEAISEPPPKTMLIVESVARGVALQGLKFEEIIRSFYAVRPIFEVRPPSPSPISFLESSDPYHAFYRKKRDEYIAQVQDGTLDPPPHIPYVRPPVDDFEPPPERDQPKRPKRDRPQPPPPLRIPVGITLTELGVIKLTAQFVARYGIVFWKFLVPDVCLNPLFTFMKRKDSNFSFYNGLVLAYQRVLRPPVRGFPVDIVLDGFFHWLQLDENVIDLHAFVAGLYCFTHIDDDAGDLSATMPPPQPLSVTMTHPDMPPPTQHPEMPPHRALNHQDQDDNIQPTSAILSRITLKQLGIIKLTAQFVARYGKLFTRELMMRAVMLPHFEFMFFRHGPRPFRTLMGLDEIRFQVFSILVKAYSRILMPCKKNLKKLDASLLEVFFHRLQLEKLEEGSETAMIDLHAFVAGVDYLAHMDAAEYSDIMPPPERLSVMMMNRPTHKHSGVLAHLPRGPLPGDYGPLSRGSPALSADTIPPGITPQELRIIKLTAQFTMRFGMLSFSNALMNRVSMTSMRPLFEFIKVTDSRRCVFLGFMEVYSSVLKPSKKVEKSDDCMATAVELFLHCLTKGVDIAFMSGVEYFASVDDAGYSAVMDPPERLFRTINRESFIHYARGPLLWSIPHRCPGPVTPTELVRIKLTAVFVARYGVRICRDLMKKVDMKPEFKFIEPADGRFPLYRAVVNAYSKVLRASDHADTETVLKRYLDCPQWEKLKEGVPVDWHAFEVEEGVPMAMAMATLYAFVEGVDCFAQMEDDYYSALMGNPLTRMPGKSCRPPLPLREEPEPKRQKLDETARAFARGSSKIRVSVPLMNERHLIEITGNPLKEKVASLKEKIAWVIHKPVNKLKLSGKAGVLKDDKSLADNNVAPGEILTLSWFISRWSN